MRTADELYKAVNDYMKRRNWQMKKSMFNPFEKTYQVTTMEYDELNAKIIQGKHGKYRVVFKVNGKVTSIYD